ncbi:MAG TPA: dihydrofolate reductase family protein [Candidatus Saccharimonadales bacterium]|nr:dihydrofolate reductase family protein [Candidatus Saccharimonadales bacterium]
MKVFVIAALSVDGFIGPRDSTGASSLEWTSKEDTQHFMALTKQAGVIVMGSTTYGTIGKPLKGRRNLVYNATPIDHPDVETVSETPQALVARLEREGCAQLAVCGGHSIYKMFLQAGVVDELYLTIEPIMFGEGIPLAATPLKLELIDTKQINDNAIALHYKIKK